LDLCFYWVIYTEGSVRKESGLSIGLIKSVV